MDLVNVRSSSLVWSAPDKISTTTISKTVVDFLDTASTSFGRATAYNTREEQQTAELAAHQRLFSFDRDLYSLLLLLPGVTDRARQVGTRNLLAASRTGSLLSPELEREALYTLIRQLPPQRMFKLFVSFRHGSETEGIPKANNSRTRKLVLRTVLNAEKIELWAVKYRSKMREVLTHCWGKRKTGILRLILAKDPSTWEAHERAFVHENIDRFGSARSRAAVRFVFGLPEASLPLFRDFYAARTDLSAGKRLPMEVLEGIRSTYHKNIKKEEVLKVTKESLTKNQKMAVQKRAEAAGVEVTMDPKDYDPVRLYIYAYEQGMTKEIGEALLKKAAQAAKSFPFKSESIGLLIDGSQSMFGDKTQKLRPMAATLAIRDMLSFTAQKVTTVLCGGVTRDELLVMPSGDTSLAKGFMQVVSEAPDVIFVLSDGYENAPAGRFQETVTAARKLGVNIPIYHINPVFAAEVKGVRQLAEEVPTLPAQDPQAMGISILRGYLDRDPIKGINLLINMALPQLQGGA